MAKDEKRNPWPVIVIILIVLFFFSTIAAIIIGVFSGNENGSASGNTLIIPINGEIISNVDDSIFSSGGASSQDIVSEIKDAEQNQNIKAVIFEINSPGGSPVASHEIAKAIKNMTKPNVAVIREMGTSGAYWAASSTNHIVADEMSVVGSVGVLSSYVGFYGIMNKYNVTYERLVAGDNKDIMTPYRPMTDKEKAAIEFKIANMQQFFLEDVATSRNLTRQEKSEISSAMFYIGTEAKDLHLIDEFGGIDEATAYLQTRMGEKIVPYRVEQPKSFIQTLMGASAAHGFAMGQGLGKTLVLNNDGSQIQMK